MLDFTKLGPMLDNFSVHYPLGTKEIASKIPESQCCDDYLHFVVLHWHAVAPPESVQNAANRPTSADLGLQVIFA